MTITVEGSLKGPPPFDAAAFKAKLAKKLDMQSEQFKVKKVNRGGSKQLHEVQTSSDCFITVDVDEEGYLRHESSSSESAGSGSEASEASTELAERRLPRHTAADRGSSVHIPLRCRFHL